MGRFTLWAVIVAVVVVFVGGGFTFRTLWPKEKHTQTTVDLTPAQRQALIDSMDAVLAKKVLIIKRGHSVSRGKDTVYVETSDTTTINGLYSLIDALAMATEPPQTHTEAPTPPQKRFFGMGPSVGATYSFQDSKVYPLLGISVEFGKNEFMPMVGYDGGWTGTFIYRRRF